MCLSLNCITASRRNLGCWGCWAAAWVWGVVGLCFGLVGCVTTIRPPSDVVEPVAVLLLDHGHTPSLVMPVDEAEARIARYAYGEYRYYALGDAGFTGAVRALFWPTRGALGRRVMPGPLETEHVLNTVRIPSERVVLIHVERAKLIELRDDLDWHFTDQMDSATVRAEADLVFVHHPTRYSLFHNSNHAVADWLERLGCEVRGPAMVSWWRVEEAERP